ncbi:MAG: hypothetical protein Q4E98_09185 [Acidaminococcaceae bacterium]|nr:hypothetical protein [Acidaminococcaceae bacterium]
MDNLMLFYPLIVLLFFIFFDVRNRKKRPAPPPQQPKAEWPMEMPEQMQGRRYEDEDEDAVPWYVEFPEDRAPKKPPVEEKVYQEPAPAVAAEAAVSEPLYKRFETQKSQPAFKGFRSRRTVAGEVRHGFVMAMLLDKPRSLKPYDDSF